MPPCHIGALSFFDRRKDKTQPIWPLVTARRDGGVPGGGAEAGAWAGGTADDDPGDGRHTGGHPATVWSCVPRLVYEVRCRLWLVYEGTLFITSWGAFFQKRGVTWIIPAPVGMAAASGRLCVYCGRGAAGRQA